MKSRIGKVTAGLLVVVILLVGLFALYGNRKAQAEPIDTYHGAWNEIKDVDAEDGDAFLSVLYQLVINYMGKEYCQKIHPSFIEINKNKICKVKVDKYYEPVWFIEGNIKTFYIRTGQSTRCLDAKETHDYISYNF